MYPFNTNHTRSHFICAHSINHVIMHARVTMPNFYHIINSTPSIHCIASVCTPNKSPCDKSKLMNEYVIESRVEGKRERERERQRERERERERERSYVCYYQPIQGK